MITGTTKTGFRYKINENALNNYELLEYISEVEENPLVAPKLFKMLLGENQLKELKNHVRDSENNVPIEKMMEEIQEIFNSQNKIKNY